MPVVVFAGPLTLSWRNQDAEANAILASLIAHEAWPGSVGSLCVTHPDNDNDLEAGQTLRCLQRLLIAGHSVERRFAEKCAMFSFMRRPHIPVQFSQKQQNICSSRDSNKKGTTLI